MDDATTERWLPVPGYEGLYEVSDQGNVWSAPRATTRGGLLKLITGTAGYKWVTLTKNGKQKRFQVHRLVMLAFVGPCPPGMEVRHLDGNPAHNARTNLAYGDHSTNMRDRREHGTDPYRNKTHCPKGHPYAGDNLVINSKGGRACRECARIQGREWARAHATRKDPAMVCPHCKQEFERPLGQGARKYCSEECFTAARTARRELRKVAA